MARRKGTASIRQVISQNNYGSFGRGGKNVKVFNVIATLFLLLGASISYAGSANITESEYGEKWPLTVQNGTLNCTPLGTLGIVTFTANGITYAVNGTAKARAKQNGWREIDEIWRDNPNPQYGPKINIGPIVEKGLSLCK